MQDVLMAGKAESGYGVTLAGFHCPIIQIAAKLSELEASIGRIDDFAVTEDNGWATCVALHRETTALPPTKKMATFRREPHKFFQDLPKFLYSTKAVYVDRIGLSGSLGSVSFTLLYRPVESSV